MAAAVDHMVAAAPKTSSEEADQRDRSHKKVKRTDALNIDFSVQVSPADRLFPEDPKRKGSYKYMLTGQSSEEAMPDAKQEDSDGFLSEESDPEDEDEEDPFCPTIRLSSTDKKRIYQRWKNSLIIKLLGKKVGYHFLHRTLMNQWKPRGEIIMADMGNDFYLLQFNTKQDYNRVLYDGPWIVADHVLTVRKWQPRFDPDEATIDRAVIWVQIPKLYREYYDQSILFRVAKRVGRPIKVDEVTLKATRVKYARVCVEVDLTKPSLSKFHMHRRVLKLVYEGLDSICFMCGHYGHGVDSCHINPEPKEAPEMDNQSDKPTATSMTEEANIEEERPELFANHGLWMIAQRRHRGRPKTSKPILNEKATASPGSHFALLSDHQDDILEGPSELVQSVPPVVAQASSISLSPTPVVQVFSRPPVAPSTRNSHVVANVVAPSPAGSAQLQQVPPVTLPSSSSVHGPPKAATSVSLLSLASVPSKSHASMATKVPIVQPEPLIPVSSPPEPPDRDAGLHTSPP
ncbi:hypothetical protein Tsubulata_038190 [Turnera subulata]|uniref:DUF4283 domain-containing protein n=1 Tax=Turnera subulata TaxID=218843 RepID=A0A9Q0JK06_9ROSI|nr:hypothetical protein Tsubulata_038190 [Turnera subulata]